MKNPRYWLSWATAVSILAAPFSSWGIEAAAQQALQTTKEKRLTIVVECGSQGQVDADWSIEFDLYDKDGKKKNSKPLKVSVPSGTGSGAAAQRVKTAANMAAGAGNTAAGAEETKHDQYNPPKNSNGNSLAEDVVLKNGYCIKNIKVKKEGKVKKTGHLKVLEWTYCPPKENAEPPRSGLPGADGAIVRPIDGAGQVVIGPAPDPQPLPLSRLTIKLLAANPPRIGLDIALYGTAADGSHWEVASDQTYDGATTSLPMLAGLLGAWANANGFVATYPSPTTVEIDFTGAAVDVGSFSFAMYIAANPVDDMGGTYVKYDAESH